MIICGYIEGLRSHRTMLGTLCLRSYEIVAPHTLSWLHCESVVEHFKSLRARKVWP